MVNIHALKITIKENKVLRFLRWLLSRAMVFYLLLFVLHMFIVNYENVVFGLKIRILDNTMPSSFQHLIDISTKDEPANKEFIKEYMMFYVRIAAFFPDRADAYNMLGYCFYKNGQLNDAVKSYQKAISIESDFFWPYYNLGLLYLKNGYYAQAREQFAKAVETDSKRALEIIKGSTIIYRGILISNTVYMRNTTHRLNVAYENTRTFLKVLNDQELFNKLKNDLVEKLKRIDLQMM